MKDYIFSHCIKRKNSKKRVVVAFALSYDEVIGRW